MNIVPNIPFLNRYINDNNEGHAQPMRDNWIKIYGQELQNDNDHKNYNFEFTSIQLLKWDFHKH